jgi:GNAT superfamily N-acetyltransferase
MTKVAITMHEDIDPPRTNGLTARQGAVTSYHPLKRADHRGHATRTGHAPAGLHRRPGPPVDADIRELTATDWHLDRTVTLSAIAQAPEAFKMTMAEALAHSDEEWRGIVAVFETEFVAMHGGKPVGMAGGVKHPESDSALQLVSIFVEPEARGNGTSDLLVRSVVDWAQDNGYQEVRLWVLEDHFSAVHLYERTGFRPTGATNEGPRGPRFEMAHTLR